MRSISEELDRLRNGQQVNSQDQQQESDFSQQSQQSDISSYLDSLRGGQSQKQQPNAQTGSFGQPVLKAEGFGQDAGIGGIQGILLETIRGLYQGTESLMNTADSATKLIENTTGLKRGGLFEDLAKLQKTMQELIPETDVGDIGKTVFNFLGQSPGIIAEFEAVPVGKLTGIPSLAAKMGVLQSLEDYNKEESGQSLVKGFTTGALVGTATGLTFAAAGKGMDLLNKFGKTTAKTWIKLTTGDAKLAEDFVNNPKKYNLNPFGKMKSNEDIVKEFKDKRNVLDKELSLKIDSFKNNQTIQKEALAVENAAVKSDFSEAIKNSQESLKEESRQTLGQVLENSNKVIEQRNTHLKNQAESILEESGGKIKLIKEAADKEVSAAIDHMSNLRPGEVVESKYVLPKIQEVIAKESPYILKGNELKPRTALSGDTTDLTKINAMIKEINSVADEGFTPKYLQDLKNASKNLADKEFRTGEKALGKMYSALSKAVDPAKLVQSNTNLQSRFSELSEKNLQYSQLIPKYKEAQKYYFKEDQEGRLIPVFENAINAIKSDNRFELGQMRKADSLLPPEDRILPKLQKLVSEIEKANSDNKSLVSLAKRKAQQTKLKLDKANREAVGKLNAERRNLTFQNSQQLRQQLRDFHATEQKKLNGLISSLEEQETFLLNQNTLREFVTQGKGLVPTAQRANIFSAIGGAQFGRPEVAIPSAVNVGLLSPKLASGVSKQFLINGGKVTNSAKDALKNETLQRLLASSLSKNLSSR